MPAREAIQHWREANRVASEMERQLAQAWARFFEGHGAEPAAVELAEAKRLRAAADAALLAAMRATGADVRPPGNG